MEATLNVQTRDSGGKGVARSLRREGRVPGVVYGGDQEAVMVSIEAREALKLFHEISVENTIIELDFDGKNRAPALVREIQTHPFKAELLHVDFLRIQKGVAIELQVPIHLAGTPDGVRNEGGLMDHIIHELPIKCIPSLIPEVVELDVTALAIGDALRVADVHFEEGVEILLEEDRIICHVVAPRVVEEVVDEELAEGEEGVAPEAAAEGEEATEESGGDDDG